MMDIKLYGWHDSCDNNRKTLKITLVIYILKYAKPSTTGE